MSLSASNYAAGYLLEQSLSVDKRVCQCSCFLAEWRSDPDASAHFSDESHNKSFAPRFRARMPHAWVQEGLCQESLQSWHAACIVTLQQGALLSCHQGVFKFFKANGRPAVEFEFESGHFSSRPPNHQFTMTHETHDPPGTTPPPLRFGPAARRPPLTSVD